MDVRLCIQFYYHVLDDDSWIIPAHKDVLLMSQVFSQEKSIYEAVEGAFTSLYMKRSPSETALNLITLTLDGSIGDLASIEALVSKFTAKGDISHGTVLEFAIVVSYFPLCDIGYPFLCKYKYIVMCN